MLTGPIRTNFREIWFNQNTILIPENYFENIVCKKDWMIDNDNNNDNENFFIAM